MTDLVTYLMNLIFRDRITNDNVGGVLVNLRDNRIKITYNNKTYVIDIREE